MGWILLILGIALVCGALWIVVTTHDGVPVRHARRLGRHSAAAQRSGLHRTHRSRALIPRRRSASKHSASKDSASKDSASKDGTGKHAGSRHASARGDGELATMARHMHLLRRPADVQPQDDDPFEVLALQCRLTALASEIQRLERDRSTIALAHHLRATQYAYDMLLAEACQLIGLASEAEAPPVPDEVAGVWIVDEVTRMRKELELSSRGWTW